MRRVIAGFLFVLVGWTAGLADAAAAPRSPEVEQFTKLEKDWMDALKRQDRAALEGIMASDYALVNSFAGEPLAVTPRGPWIEAAATFYKVESFEFKDVHVRRFGETAFVSSWYTQKGTVRGVDRSGDFFLTDIWVKKGGRWRVAARYSSRPEVRVAPAPPPK